ncbi:MAG: hypothetical protein Q4D13_02555 [Erysipelotrichaceae bacterium]|nr:hypothetical protein [Erysipelotrichaceae bacterium]
MAKKKVDKYPSKKYVNLYQVEKQKLSNEMIIGIVAFCILFGLFVKFAVIDRLALAIKSTSEVNKLQTQLVSLQRENENYEEVLKQYQHYYFDSTYDDLKTVDAVKVLNMLDMKLYDSNIVSVQFSGKILVVQISGIDLQGASGIITRLNESNMVDGVSVSTANSLYDENAVAMINMTITLKEIN